MKVNKEGRKEGTNKKKAKKRVCLGRRELINMEGGEGVNRERERGG